MSGWCRHVGNVGALRAIGLDHSLQKKANKREKQIERRKRKKALLSTEVRKMINEHKLTRVSACCAAHSGATLGEEQLRRRDVLLLSARARWRRCEITFAPFLLFSSCSRFSSIVISRVP